jgi:predicted lipoprotein
MFTIWSRKDVIPYLIRRAEENTSVAGQTSRELQMIKGEKKKEEGSSFLVFSVQLAVI